MNALIPSRQPTITFAPDAHDMLMKTVGAHPPETYAVLAGRLDAPLHVTDVRPMPPMMDARGRVNAGGGHVQLNAPFVQHYANVELHPYGKTVLGICHSHPGSMKVLSRGRPGSGDGDIASIRGTLERGRDLVSGWTQFLAPIITFDEGIPEVTGWIVSLDVPEPIAADVLVTSLPPAPAHESRAAEPEFPIAEWRENVNAYLSHINDFSRLNREDAEILSSFWRELMREDLEKKRASLGARQP